MVLDPQRFAMGVQEILDRGHEQVVPDERHASGVVTEIDDGDLVGRSPGEPHCTATEPGGQSEGAILLQVGEVLVEH